jgi:predicted Zn-dependent protease
MVAMQRRLNTKLLLCTLASLAVLFTAVHLVHSHQMHRNAGALMREAERAVQQKDYARAVVLLQHYLAYEPNDTEAIGRYALALSKATPSGSARFKTFLLLEQVLRRLPDRHDLRRHAIQAAIDLNRLADAVRHLEYLLKAMPHQGDLEHQQGWCQEALGHYKQSAASFRSAIKHAPHQVDSYILLAELLQRRLDQRDEAAKVMDAMVAANPKSWQAYLARARFHYGRGNLDSAGRDILEASKLAPHQADVLLAGAELALLTGNLTLARDFVYRGLKLHPHNERLYRSLATLELRAHHPDEAIACLRLGLEKLPASAGLRVQLAEVYLDQRQPAQARKQLAWVEQNAKSPGLVDYLQGRLLMLDDQWLEAIEKLLSARQQLGLASEWASGICASLGRCYEQIGEPEQQLAAVRTAIMLDAGDLATRLELGKAMLACQMADDAAVELRNLTLLPNAPAETWVWLAKALIERIRLRPGVKYPWKEVEDVLEQAGKATPNAALLPCLRAAQLNLQGKLPAALALLQKSAQERPQEIKLRTTLAELLLGHGKKAEALAVLQQAHQDFGPQFAVQQALIHYWVQVGGTDARKALVQIVHQPGQLTPGEKIRLLRGLADSLLQLGDKRTAQTVLQQQAALQPKDLRSRLMLLDLALADNRDADTLQLLASLRKIEGEEGAYWRIGEAARWIHLAYKGDKSKLPLARQRLAEVAKLYRDWGRAALLEAYVDDLEGFPERAIDKYRRAIDLGERAPEIVLRVARWLYDHGRYGDADLVIRRLEDVMPLPAEIARLGAEIALRNHEPSRALVLAQQAVPATSGDYRDQLWLAQVQWLAGHSALAEETLRLAVKANSRMPEVWVALAHHLARTGKSGEVDKLLEEVRQKLPADRLTLTLARCNEGAGRHAKAEELYKKALAVPKRSLGTRRKYPADFVAVRCLAEFYCRSDQFAKAEPYLRMLIDPQVLAPGNLTAWASRQLALGLAAGDFQQALALLKNNRSSKVPAVEDERAYAFVLGSQSVHRQEALRLLELSLAKKPLSADEQFLLVQLYDSSGQHVKSGDQMQSLLAFHGDNAQYLAYHIRSLLQRGEISAARVCLTTLEHLEPATPRTQQLQAAIRKAQMAGK